MPNSARPAARLAIRICPADVGRRVTLRHRLVGDTRLTDVVGHLVAWDDGALSVRRRDGATATVQASDLVAGKVVPPEVSAYDAQRVAEAGWPPERSEPLGDWTLRWAHGVTGRANSVRIGDDPGLPLPDALARVTAWYAGVGAAPALQVPLPWTHDAQLDALGWSWTTRHALLLTTPTEELLAACQGPAVPEVEVTGAASPTDDWLALLADEPPRSWQAYRRILTAPARTLFLTARATGGGPLLGVGRVCAGSLPDGRARWAGITSIATAPAARRRGVSRAVMLALATWALEQGCATTYLQVLAENTVARAMYDRLGFTVHHHYVYRSAAPGT